jgi:formamidopyrimidine-DNA glycosylase
VPELPDIEAYRAALGTHAVGQRLEEIRLASASLLRTVDPPLADFAGRRLTGTRRLGKRLVLAFEEDGEAGPPLFLVLHLMIAGRLRWRPRESKAQGRRSHAALRFERGTLLVTEAGTKKRATLHAVRGEAALAEHDPGGLEPLACDLAAFRERVGSESHTLKRALTDPRLLAGVGGAYADEILHRARLSPVKLTGRLGDEEWARLFEATRAVLDEWTERLVDEARVRFPEKVTAFREGMAVHGRYGEPCPDCGALVQRIVHASNETNYCARCQTGGRVLADRALSRLLRRDWPRTLEELERRRPGRGTGEGALSPPPRPRRGR